MSATAFSPDTFRHLCRSSPWRWQTLRFELRSRSTTAEREAAGTAETSRRAATNTVAGSTPNGGGGNAGAPAVAAMNCWVRRPGALRVETLDGALLTSTTKINDSRGALYISGNRKPWLLSPSLVNPVHDELGYVVRRPEALYGEPAYGSGRFSSALDPVELAGERPVPLESPFANVAEIDDIAEVMHQGRPAIEAILSPNPGYRPHFPEAPLLFPGRTAIRIDVETAVCVASQSLDGDTAGAGHQIKILGIDEYMLDDLFEEISMGLTDVRAHIPWDLDF